MNEQIKQLADKAGLELIHNQFLTAAQQKFAQLIVAECLKKIENEASTYAEPVWAYEIVNDIKEHFGVES